MQNRNRILFYLILALYGSMLFSQTGPGGVGTTSNNALWLKADAGTSSTTNSVAISTWADQSGNGVDLTQTVSVQQPSFTTNILNGFPAILFDNSTTTGQNDKMIGPDSPALDNTNGYTFFTVTRPMNFGDAHVILSKRTGVSLDESFMLFYYTSNKLFVDIENTDDRFSSNTTFSANTGYIIDLQYNGTLPAASRCTLYSEETLDKTSGETNSVIPDNASPILLGTTDASDGRPYGGYMSEIIIYREALVPAKRIIVNNYLSAKYNIALSTNDKYAGDNPADGDYDRDVCGVGQESTGSSISFSASVSHGLSLAVTAGLDNTDYILAGNAVPLNSINSTDVAGMTGTNQARWQRIWFVDVTNTSTNMTANLEFDMSDADMGAVTPGVVSNYVLLYRAGQTGSWTELAVASATVGDRIQFSGITLSNDGYYTLGSRDYNNSPLPIELIYFKAAAAGKQVNLSWATATEKNTSYFVIEKTKNGSDFEKVASVSSAGESTSNKTYTSVDADPYPGLSYYRLTEVTKDEKRNPYPLIAVSFDKNEGFIIFPNPADNLVYIKPAAAENTSIHLMINDAAGKLCFEETYVTKEANETLQLETKFILKGGAYLFTVVFNGKTFGQKIIIN